MRIVIWAEKVLSYHLLVELFVEVIGFLFQLVAMHVPAFNAKL